MTRCIQNAYFGILPDFPLDKACPDLRIIAPMLLSSKENVVDHAV